MEWLIDETTSVSPADVPTEPDDSAMRGRRGALIAVRLNDVVVHDTRKWFGEADIRLDAIVVHGPDAGAEDAGNVPSYQPATFRFPGVRDGDRLPIEPPGLLVFFGRPRHFIDIAIAVSRDRKDTADLGELITAASGSAQWEAASAVLTGLAVAVPPAAAVIGAVKVAGGLAEWAVKLVAAATGNTVGLYRTHFLQRRDRFGFGRHPEADSYRVRDLSFWYEIVPERAPG